MLGKTPHAGYTVTRNNRHQRGGSDVWKHYSRRGFAGWTILSNGIDTHWVTKNHTVWNEQERVSEERELVYEISWMPELSAWRSFLRSQRRLVTNS